MLKQLIKRYKLYYNINKLYKKDGYFAVKEHLLNLAKKDEDMFNYMFFKSRNSYAEKKFANELYADISIVLPISTLAGLQYSSFSSYILYMLKYKHIDNLLEIVDKCLVEWMKTWKDVEYLILIYKQLLTTHQTYYIKTISNLISQYLTKDTVGYVYNEFLSEINDKTKLVKILDTQFVDRIIATGDEYVIRMLAFNISRLPTYRMTPSVDRLLSLADNIEKKQALVTAKKAKHKTPKQPTAEEITKGIEKKQKLINNLNNTITETIDSL